MNNKSKPFFPKRAVITGGMPYGDKKLHFGHIGGMFIHADIYARFLRDRIGKDNVIFVSGTDCYGAGPEVKFQTLKENGFPGTIEDFITENHNAQKETLDAYGISLNLYAASALGKSKDVHEKVSVDLFNSLYENGYLRVEEIMQFFDEETGEFLNGRQVEGRCPIQGCKSESAYADECSLGHQYSPSDLIAPLSVINGKTPSLKAVSNWYFDLQRFTDELKARQSTLKEEGISRRVLLSVVDDFLKEPIILVKTDDFATLRSVCEKMPEHEIEINEEKQSATIKFTKLRDRETACELLRNEKIRFRTGTTLVPLRLTGNVNWGIKVPEKDGISGQTFWVWPESLWAPISFLKTYLETTKGSSDGWEEWWCADDSRVYQFIGEDCIYFYALAGMGIFMAMNNIAGRETSANLPLIVPNRHAHYGKAKASSSGAIKPPGAEELLDYYTVEQLRMHFAHMALHSNSVSFNPKALMEGQSGFDATLAEGNILTNVYNRLIRSCFYTMQKYFDGNIPSGEVSLSAKEMSDTMINDYEWAMYKFEFARVIDLLDVYLREANKIWSAETKEADGDPAKLSQTLIDAFHVVRVAATLLHPFAPIGTEMVREYLNVDERLWDWQHINNPLRYFMDTNHNFKFLEPRVDFFAKHPSQIS